MTPTRTHVVDTTACDRIDRWLGYLIARSFQGVLILILGLLIPLPDGIWHFGQDPQWLVAIEEPRIVVGPITGPLMSSRAAYIALRMLLVGLPMLMVGKMLQRPRRSTRSGAHGPEPT